MSLLHLRLIGLVLVLASAFVSYTWVRHDAVAEYKTEQLVVQAESDKKQRLKYEAVAQELEELKLKRAQNAKIVYKETERVIQAAPVVYAASCWDDDGLRNANAAIRGTHISEPASAVPAD
jgi:hypothetical protein